MGHAVLTAERLDEVIPFYTEILGFQPTDYILKPFAAYFFHINPRHHSLAFIDTGKNGIHHLMVELCYLDDVGQAYDLALRKPEMIGTTFGRHVNDQVTSFYSWSPSKFLFEYGWGGRSIDRRQLDAARAHRGPEPVGPRPRVAHARRPRAGARPARERRRSRRARPAQRDGRQLPARRRRLPVVERRGGGA